MQFELLPILDCMTNLYEMPLANTRFQAYLRLLQGSTKGDLAMPIAAFNPMAKAHILLKIRELQNLHAE